MARKRMFNNEVLDTDAFLGMPLSAQALYFHLNLRADDDGFVSNPKRVQKYIGASEDDLSILIMKRFLIAFDDGVIVIKHWRMHNTLRADRYNPTNYQEDFKMLGIKANNAYTLEQNEIMATNWQPTGNQLATNGIPTVSTDIDIDIDIDKNSIDKYIVDFDAIWSLYPRKDGKSAISNSKKKEICKIGFDEMSRAISRYAKTVEGKDRQYILMGSTFFNTRYKDFLDECFEEEEVTNVESKSGYWQ